MSVGSAITYAVKYLQVQHIVVCGHTNCGGITAINDINNIDDFALKSWVSNLKGNIEDNVLYSIENLKTYPIIQEHINLEKINLHAWIYDIETLNIKIYDGLNWVFANQIITTHF